MTPTLAQELAVGLFDDHPAAVPLLMEINNPSSTPERRERSRRALLALDPDEPLPGPLDGPARSVAQLLLARIIYCPDPKERARIADLLREACRCGGA